MADSPPPKAPVLVTGGGRGVGFEIARLYADRGHDLVLVGADGDRLVSATESIEAEYGVIVMPMAIDLAEPGAVADLHERIRERELPITALINADERRVTGSVGENGFEAEVGQVRVNAVAPVGLIARLLPRMIERGEGAILNVASVAAFYVSPGLTGYHASEAHLLRYTRGLAAELRGTDVAVTALCPGTSAAEGATAESTHDPRPTTREIAVSGFNGLERGRTVVVPDVRSRAIVTMLHVLPAPIVRTWAEWTGRRRMRR